MKFKVFSVFLLIILVFSTQNVFAAALLMRIQQQKAGRQQPTEEEYQQHQQEEQAQQQQQKNAVQTYQQTVDQRNQAIAQAILEAHNPSISSETLVASNNNQPVSQNQQPFSTNDFTPQPTPAANPTPALPTAGSTTVKDVVDLSDVWKKLDIKSTVWTLIIDDQAKVMTVSEYIDRYQKQGVKINQPAEHYVQMIDQITQANPELLDRPFGELLQIVAIVDYDFDNGINKDELAKKVLGEEGYEQNKKRFTH